MSCLLTPTSSVQAPRRPVGRPAKARIERRGRPSIYPFAKMAVGESVLVPANYLYVKRTAKGLKQAAERFDPSARWEVRPEGVGFRVWKLV